MKRRVGRGRGSWQGTRMFLVGLFVSASGLTVTACASAPGQPPANTGVVVAKPLTKQILNVPLVTQSGATTTLQAMKGHTLLVLPFLTLCPDVCPFTTGNLLSVQRSIDAAKQQGRIKVIEVSVDPERDTQERLAQYAKDNGTSWDVVRSTPEGTQQLIKFFGWTVLKQPASSPPTIDWLTGEPLTYDLAHSDGYSVIDSAGVLRFANGSSPHFHGILPAKLRAFLSDEGRSTLRHPEPNGWKPVGALDALSWVAGTRVPLASN